MSMGIAIISPFVLQQLQASASPCAIVDARPSADYLAGHLPGAVWMGWEEWCEPCPSLAEEALTQPGYWGVLGDFSPASISARFALLGLHNHLPILVYADGSASRGREARIAWMLLYWGASHVWLLDGGWKNWLGQGGHLLNESVGRSSGFLMRVSICALWRVSSLRGYALSSLSRFLACSLLPATLLVTGGIADEHLAGFCPEFSANDLLQDDVNKFPSLARSHTPIGDLREATAGELERSPRYRDLLAPLSLRDELRAALITNGSCWGFMSIYRDQSAPPFTPAETAFLAGILPHIALGLRKALLLGEETDLQRPDAPGVLLLTDNLSVVASNPAAQNRLSQVSKADWPNNLVLPSVICQLVGRLQALEQGTHGQPELPPIARMRTASGHWLLLHACRLRDQEKKGQIAVIFEVAQPSEVASLIVQAYDLTKRESEIVQSVLHGLSTKEIATTFQISSNTVQDHLKAIFEKVGVHSRRELVGQIFAQQYQPRIAAGCSLNANGWFI